MLRGLAVGGIVIGALLTACGGDDTNALRTQVVALQTQVGLLQTALSGEADRVVAFEAQCVLRASDGISYHDVWGDACRLEGTPISGYSDRSVAVSSTGNGNSFINRRQVLTIRTPRGVTYTVAVPLTQSVKVGDPWPPP